MLVSYEYAFDSDSDASESETDEVARAESHSDECSVRRFTGEDAKGSFENCFLPVPASARIQAESSESGPGSTRTVASESVSSSCAWPDFRNFDSKEIRSAPLPKVAFDDYSPTCRDTAQLWV